MKKSFKLLLCLSVIASLCGVAAGCQDEEEHKHTYAATWSSNENGHWYAATCEHTDQKANLSTHTDSNNDGVCEVCGYGADHVHTYAETLSYDENNHWYAVTCGHSVDVKGKTAHVDSNNDSLCDDCGYDYDHTHEYALTWSGDTANHWHVNTCECTIDVADKAAHEDEDDDGICDICKLPTYETTHTHTPSANWGHDEDNHWHWGACESGEEIVHTGAKIDVTAHTDTINNETKTSGSDGVCDTCGYYDELHEHTPNTSYWENNLTQHWRATNCGHTSVKLSVANHTDTDKDGICDVCKGYTYDTTAHTHSYDLNTWQSDVTYHWHMANCTDPDHTGLAGTKSVHVDWNLDGVCDTCNAYTYDASHTHDQADTYSKDDEGHWYAYTCGHSGLAVTKAGHVYEGDSEICKDCGYSKHEHVASESWVIDSVNHTLSCGSCDTVMVSGAHVDVKNVELDRDGADGLCDVCGYVMDSEHEHTLTLVNDENGHWNTCSTHVGVQQSYAAHYDNDSNGYCDKCEYNMMEEGHTHTYDETVYYSKGTEGHYFKASCHTYYTTEAVAHTDEINNETKASGADGLCDVCGYTTDPAHVHDLVYTYNATEHSATCSTHSGYVTKAAEHTGMTDGVCDVCGYKDFDDTHTHTYEEEYSYDYNAHWYKATCSHTALITKEPHVDVKGATDSEGAEIANGYCDVCGNEMFSNIVSKITSDEAKNVVIGGTYTNEYGSTWYEYGDQYYHEVDIDTAVEKWYAMVDGSFVGAQYTLASGYTKLDSSEDYLNGLSFSENEIYFTAYGFEAGLAAIWDEAYNYGSDLVITGSNGSYSFSYTAYGYDNVVSFTTGTYKGVTYIQSFEVTSGGYTLSTQQKAGTRTASFPLDIDNFLATSWDLYLDGNKVENNATIELVKDSTKAYFYFENYGDAVLSFETFSSTVDGVDESSSWNQTFGITGHMDKGYIEINASAWGPAEIGKTYVVVFKTTNVEFTLNVKVIAAELSSFDAKVYDVAGDTWTTTSSWNAYVGDLLLVRSWVNTNAASDFTAELISKPDDSNATLSKYETSDDVTITASMYSPAYAYSLVSDVVGEYVVKLISTADSSYTAIVTFTLAEPPKASDILKGSYSYNDYYVSGYTVYVTFTPASEGAVEGTAVVTLVDNSDKATVYNVNYVYDETNGLVMTNEDNSEFEDVIIAYEHYELTAQWLYEGWFGTEMTAANTLVESEPYTPPTVEEMVAGQYRYEVIAANGWSLESATDIVLNEDGTGTYTRWHFDENYNEVIDAQASFTWTVVDNGDDTYSVTVVLAEDATTELAAGTWTIGEVSGTDNWGYTTTYTAITGVMVNGAATVFPVYD